MSGFKLKNLPAKYKLAGGLALFAFLVFVLLMAKSQFGSSGGASPESSAKALTPRSVDATVGGPGSPEYNQMIDELNRAGAELAREKGESFVATPIGSKTGRPAPKAESRPEEANRRPVLEMPPQPQGRPAAARAPRETSQAALEASRQRAYSEALASDLKTMTPPPLGAMVIKNVEKPKSEASPGSGPGSATTAALAIPRPGELLYAVTTLGVNSDVPSPVLATVIQGKWSGLKLLGEFQLNGRLLSIAFTKAVSPDGRELGLKAVAVDSRTNSPAVSASVDTHFLERWGALMAASFLEGLGEAMRGRGTTVRSDGEILVAERGGVSMGDVSIEALGQVGSQASIQLEKGFDRPPTVILPSGSAIGVLIIEAQAASDR